MWFQSTVSDLDPVELLLDAATALPSPDAITDPSSLLFDPTAHPASRAAAAALLRGTVSLPPPMVRPYFAVCAVETWRRVPVKQLAEWSGIPFNRLKRRLATATLTVAGVAAWGLALHAVWLLDVAELSPGTVVRCMRLGRTTALGAILGARAVRFSAGRVDPGAFAATLERYLAVLRASFRS